MNTDEYAAGLYSFGRKGAMIDYSAADVPLGNTVKAVVLCSAGNVVYTPRSNPANAITMTGLSAGYVLPHIPGVITKIGTTATLCTVED